MGKGRNNNTYNGYHQEVFNYQCPCGYTFEARSEKFVFKMKRYHKLRCKAIIVKEVYSTEYINKHSKGTDTNQTVSIQI